MRKRTALPTRDHRHQQPVGSPRTFLKLGRNGLRSGGMEEAMPVFKSPGFH